MPVIEVKGLNKTYRTYRKLPGLSGAVKGLFRRERKDTVAVHDISFQIEPGEFVGFLGPNGAGKTTTLKMLSGLLYPTRGEARVLDYVPWERQDGYRRQFALLLGQKNQLWWDLPARESLELNARIYGIAEERFHKTVRELTELLEVEDKLQVMVRELSLGERMKMELIASLLHRPKILFLDEPTIGLDVVSQKTVREFLKRYNQKENTTILLTSHYMADIQELCKRVIIIDHGRIFFDGPLSRVIDRYADSKIITIQSDHPERCPDGLLSQFGQVIEQTSASIRLKVPRSQIIPACKALLDQLPVNDIDIQEMPIEDIVRRLFSETKDAKTLGEKKPSKAKSIMADGGSTSPLNRFSDRVENYARYRPGYPAEVFAFLEEECGLRPASVIADIGSGTGIFTRPLLERASKVFAVEPNEAMRSEAERSLNSIPGFVSVAGAAEQTGLDAGAVDLIVAAQAFHWFDRNAARGEFKRILKPRGKVALIWNDRESDGCDFHRDYEQFLLDHAVDYQQVNHRNLSHEHLIDFFQSENVVQQAFRHYQTFDWEGLLGRVLSSSYCPGETHGRFPETRDALRRLFVRHARSGRLRMDYRTTVFAGSLG